MRMHREFLIRRISFSHRLAIDYLHRSTSLLTLGAPQKCTNVATESQSPSLHLPLE